MFGISFVELITILTICVIFIGPKEIPEVAANIAKFIFKVKKFISDGKVELAKAGKELGLDEVANQVQIDMINEELDSKKDEVTSIIDIYGNEHQVKNIGDLRSDLEKEDLEDEISKYNQINHQTNNAAGKRS